MPNIKNVVPTEAMTESLRKRFTQYPCCSSFGERSRVHVILTDEASLDAQPGLAQGEARAICAP